eukprot:1144885-Pelagomonas_calceolata.AAC.3
MTRSEGLVRGLKTGCQRSIWRIHKHIYGSENEPQGGAVGPFWMISQAGKVTGDALTFKILG